jgi:hypothetical protein
LAFLLAKPPLLQKIHEIAGEPGDIVAEGPPGVVKPPALVNQIGAREENAAALDPRAVYAPDQLHQLIAFTVHFACLRY